MSFADIQGFDPATATFKAAKRVVRLQANAAITVGKAVMLDATSDSIFKVITLTTAQDQAFFGIYEGVGGTGAATAVSGMTGRDAIAGDIVEITVGGQAKVLAYDTSGNAPVAYGPASFAVTAGIATLAAALAAGICARVTFREGQASTSTSGATTDVFINY